VFEPWHSLEQVYVNPTEKNAGVSDIQCVGADGGVDRLQQAVDALISQLPSQSVVMHATAAIHTGRPRRQENNPLGMLVRKMFRRVPRVVFGRQTTRVVSKIMNRLLGGSLTVGKCSL
jgi:hypothetical protein